MKLQAHRGVNSECPENTLSAISRAIAQGYDVIELDVGVTKDMVFVLMHDDTVNRTGRNADGSEIRKTTALSELTYAELGQYDFGSYFSPEFAGTPVCLLEEALITAKNAGIPIKIDNKYRKFSPEQKEAFFTLLEKWQDTAMLTCCDLPMLQEAAARFPQMRLHYDGFVSVDILPKLNEIVPPERLTVWLPYRNQYTYWFKGAFADPALAAEVRKHGSLGIWLLSEYEELDAAEALGAQIVETPGQLKHIRD